MITSIRKSAHLPIHATCNHAWKQITALDMSLKCTYYYSQILIHRAFDSQLIVIPILSQLYGPRWPFEDKYSARSFYPVFIRVTVKLRSDKFIITNMDRCSRKHQRAKWWVQIATTATVTMIKDNLTSIEQQQRAIDPKQWCRRSTPGLSKIRG